MKLNIEAFKGFIYLSQYLEDKKGNNMKKIMKMLLIIAIAGSSVAPIFGNMSLGVWLGYNAALSDELSKINDPNESNGGVSLGLEAWLGVGPISIGVSASYLTIYEYEVRAADYVTSLDSTKLTLAYIPTLLRGRLTFGNWFLGGGVGYAVASTSYQVCTNGNCVTATLPGDNRSAPSTMGEIGYGEDVDEDLGYEFFFRVNEIIDNQRITNFTGGVTIYFNL